MDLRSIVIRLAHRKPHLRSSLLPIIKTADELSVASNKNTPENKLDSLAHTGNKTIREAVAGNPSTSPETLSYLFSSSKEVESNQKYIYFLYKTIAANPKTPPDVLDSISTDAIDHRDVCSLVAGNPGTSQETLRRLSKFKGSIQIAVSGNTNTPPDVLVELAKVGYHAVTDKALSNTSFPSKELEELSNSDNPVILYGVVNNPKLSSHAIRSIYSRDIGGDVFSAMSGNTNTPPDVLDALSKDGEFVVNVAGNPSTPAETLIRLNDDMSLDVKANLAGNPSTPIEILEDMMKSHNHKIIELATNNLYKRKPSLKEFKGDHKIIKKSLTPERMEKLLVGYHTLPEKESYSWGEISKALNVPSLPKEAQSALLGVKDRSGRVDAVKLKEVITVITGGEHAFDIGLRAYSGLQTMHPEKSTTVIQLNISSDFESKLKSESKDDYTVIEDYIDWVTNEKMGHPVEPGKTMAWARVTDFPEKETLIIEELQSDICNGESVDNYCSRTLSEPDSLKSLIKMMSDWEFSALQAVKKFAEHKGYKTLYMVPGSVKARNNDREYGYGSGEDSALKRVYDSVPTKVGFKKTGLPDWIKENEILQEGDFLWVIETHHMKVASLRSELIKLAYGHPEFRDSILPLFVKPESSDDTDRNTNS